ncbi:hypothetical protein [Alteromonas sp. KUL49]|uniref:hypothetical protein n=1 Tax=Alteromonas sp. KUL49 TaxID=2480798 RepID=UPI00102EF3B1|nr:hypothetical protein [Alteromonas sp. KUL49]TAP34127.1 hypothetical protein EYS00_19615 [Alteromonas sp. KUL49]GEA13608.1 hypothetical protein KUL49_39830 [Alteromonas sp. KUL49]
MIDSVSGGFRTPPPPRDGSNDTITDEQSSLIEETLSNFDAENLSAEDAASIVEAFSEAGIGPSPAFADALAEAGFDAREIGDLANVGSGNRPPPPPPQSESSVDLSSVTDYLESLSDDEIQSSTGSKLAEKIAQEFGLTEGQSLIDETV